MKGFGNYKLDQISIISKARDLLEKYEAFLNNKNLIYCITEGDNPYLIYCDKDKNNNKKINFLNINNGKIERTIETQFYQAVKKCFLILHENDKENENGDYFIVSLEFFSSENKDINSGYLKCDLLIYPEHYDENNVFYKDYWGKYKYEYKEICELYLNLENNTFFYKYYGCLYNDFANTKYLDLYFEYNDFESHIEALFDNHYFSLSKIFYYKNNPYFLALCPLYIIDTKTFQIVSINHIIDKYGEYGYGNSEYKINRMNSFFEIRLFKDESGFPYMLYIVYPVYNKIKYMNLITGKVFTINISINISILKSYEIVYSHGKNLLSILPSKTNIIKYNNKNYILIYDYIFANYKIIDLKTGNIIKEILTYEKRNCFCFIYYNYYLFYCELNINFGPFIKIFNLKKFVLDELLDSDKWSDFLYYNYDDYNLSFFYDDDDKSIKSSDSYFKNNYDNIVLKIDKNRDIFKFLEYNLKYYLEYYIHVQKILKRLKRDDNRQHKQKQIMKIIKKIIIDKKVKIKIKKIEEESKKIEEERKKKFEIYIKEYESNKVKEDDEDLNLGDLFE